MVVIAYLIHIAVALVGFLSARYSCPVCSQCPAQNLDAVTKPKLEPPLSYICRVHERISKVEPVSPNKPITLFSVLGLDHTKPPFYPTDECATPYNTNNKAAEDAVKDAILKFYRTGEYVPGREPDLLAPAILLMDNTIRDFYVKEVLPNILKDGERGWRDMCKAG
ncbi:hypothetical protein FSARC_13000 [Fusarium sarcochroum]|uniref:Uncharacterized protein n=1 Tax=Fusarium sarcochroum TaxID=1208366 RepID=A0A8H4T4D3_9HYPO|nr:hypothetical protein FSARC_13000 [Fusarium sarcochroum]